MPRQRLSHKIYVLYFRWNVDKRSLPDRRWSPDDALACIVYFEYQSFRECGQFNFYLLECMYSFSLIVCLKYARTKGMGRSFIFLKKFRGGTHRAPSSDPSRPQIFLCSALAVRTYSPLMFGLIAISENSTTYARIVILDSSVLVYIDKPLTLVPRRSCEVNHWPAGNGNLLSDRRQSQRKAGDQSQRNGEKYGKSNMTSTNQLSLSFCLVFLSIARSFVGYLFIVLLIKLSKSSIILAILTNFNCVRKPYSI